MRNGNEAVTSAATVYLVSCRYLSTLAHTQGAKDQSTEGPADEQLHSRVLYSEAKNIAQVSMRQVRRVRGNVSWARARLPWLHMLFCKLRSAPEAPPPQHRQTYSNSQA